MGARGNQPTIVDSSVPGSGVSVKPYQDQREEKNGRKQKDGRDFPGRQDRRQDQAQHYGSFSCSAIPMRISWGSMRRGISRNSWREKSQGFTSLELS